MRKETQLHFDVTPGQVACNLAPPCLMAKVKKNWEAARLPLKGQDDHIIRVLEKVKSDHDKKKKNGLTEADIVKLKKTTVNLAPQDCEKRILADNLTSAVQHKAKIAVMRDYLCHEGTRYDELHEVST